MSPSTQRREGARLDQWRGPDPTRHGPWGSADKRDRTPPAWTRPGTFPVSVDDRGRSVVVTAELPGFRKQDIDLLVRRDRLLIVAEAAESDAGRYLRRERPPRRMRRLVSLPAPVERRGASASYDDGVLRVKLRKGRRRHVEVE